MKNKLFLLAAVSLPGVATAQDAPPVVDAPPSGTVSLSIAQGTGANTLIVDSRAVTLPAGRARLRFGNLAVPSAEAGVQIDLPAGRVLQQSGVGADTDSRILLTKSIGQKVTLRFPNQPPISGTLRQAAPFIIIENADGVHVENASFPYYSLERLPAEATPRSALEALVETPGANGTASLRYLTSNITWAVTYRATLVGDRLALGAWARIGNGSPAAFRNAQIALVAAPAQNGPTFALPAPVDLPSGQTREFLLADLGNAAYTQDIVWRTESFTGTASGKPRLTLSLREGAPLALPAGALTVYGTGVTGTPLLLNTGTLGPYNKGDDIRLALGETPFVNISRSVANQRRLNPKTNEFTIALTLENSGPAPVTVRVVEPIPSDAKVTQSSQQPSKSQTGNLEFLVTVPAKDNASLSYTVERPI